MPQNSAMIDESLGTETPVEPVASSPALSGTAPVEELRIRMSEAEVAVLRRCLAVCKTYLEYGAGGSTRLALTYPGIKSMTTVESDPKFIADEFSNDAAAEAALESGRLRFLTPDIGPTGAWGCPIDRSKEHLWPLYALSPFLGEMAPDLILIDGRFRVACGLTAALEAPASTILIHDYSLRPEYHLLEQFLTIEERADTLVRCRRRDDFDAYAARKLLKRYSYSAVDNSQLRMRLSAWKHGLKHLLSRVFPA